MRKLKARQGLPPDYSFVTAEFDSSDATKATERSRCAMLCQRCCICLGDFARYKELHTNGDASSRDWTVAAGYYMQAAGIWPSGGNPHNQVTYLFHQRKMSWMSDCMTCGAMHLAKLDAQGARVILHEMML